MRRVVVTGMGCVSCLGGSVQEFERRLFAGECGLSPIERFDASGLRNALAGEVRPLPPVGQVSGACANRGPATRFLAAAVGEAVLSAGRLTPRHLARACGVLSTNFAGLGSLEAAGGGVAGAALGPVLFDDGLRLLADGFGLRGPTAVLSISCASGTSAVGLARDWIRLGRADAAIVAGYDELSLYALAGLSILRTVSTDTCRPFDSERSGTIFSEGAAALVLESAEHAGRRGARILAEILGHADTNNAYHLTAPDKDGEGIRVAIRRAVEEAGVAPEEIDYVNAHGTATLYHDVTEVNALKDVLGERALRIPVTSIKGAVGHLMGAAGTIEIIASILAMRRGEAPPTVNLRSPDPACDLNHCPDRAQSFPISTVLTNSAGIGGSNASLVLRAAS